MASPAWYWGRFFSSGEPGEVQGRMWRVTTSAVVCSRKGSAPPPRGHPALDALKANALLGKAAEVGGQRLLLLLLLPAPLLALHSLRAK